MNAAGLDRPASSLKAMRYAGAGILVLLAALAGCTRTATPPGGCAPGNPVYVGHHYLEGVREVGSEILLRPDGTFAFMLAYGVNDQSGRGCWTVGGATLSLVPEGRSAASRMHTPDNRGFKGLVLEVQGRDLVWDIAGSGHRGRYRKSAS